MTADIKKIVSEMTLEEKAGLCSGLDFWHTKPVERLGVESVMLTDGPHGIRKQAGDADHLGINDSVKAVCFPAACATAASFDTELIGKMGETLGKECQAEDVSVLLGPAVNIKRSPLCGRNFEYFSEDPYLAGKMAAAYIKGVQGMGVGTSIKHFATNNQEYYRMSVSSEITERIFREIYLPAFEEAVKESQPKTVMCSYNKINGVYASENKHLLTEILRDEWGFEGYVMTDWGAVDDRVEGLKAGLDLEMPSSNGYNDAKIVEAVKNGSLDEKILDKSVERMLKVLYSYVENRQKEAKFNYEKDHAQAVDVETQCAVLLENNGILPLKKDVKAVFIGEYAAKPRYQGGGSSHINPSSVSSALDTAKSKGRNVTYVEGFPFDRDEENEAELQKAVEAARKSDVAVIFAGLPDVIESEGYDRKNMDMPVCQNKLIEAVALAQPNTIVVLHNGAPIEAPWAGDVAAILEMYIGGEGVGEATDQLLFGEANPSGRLPETFPVRIEDTACFLDFPGDSKKVYYSEGVYVGYRYYEAKHMPVKWAFGHGLSYTEFKYDNIRVSSDKLDDDTSIGVSVDVTNIGSMEGKEVVQLYVSDKTGTPIRPIKELKGFKKINLQSGETKTVTLTIKARDLSYFNEALDDWFAPSGKYEILVGHSSDDIRQTIEVDFKTKKRIPFHVDGATTMGEIGADERTAPVLKEMMKQAGELFGVAEGQEPDPMTAAMMESMPVKSLISFGGSGEQVNMLIDELNNALK